MKKAPARSGWNDSLILSTDLEKERARSEPCPSTFGLFRSVLEDLAEGPEEEAREHHGDGQCENPS